MKKKFKETSSQVWQRKTEEGRNFYLKKTYIKRGNEEKIYLERPDIQHTMLATT